MPLKGLDVCLQLDAVVYGAGVSACSRDNALWSELMRGPAGIESDPAPVIAESPKI